MINKIIMNAEYKPVIVVVAFNRVRSLERILASLSRAIYPEGTKLIISIDNNGRNLDVKEIAEKFQWPAGKKEVSYKTEHLGLRKHILSCGDLTYQYGSVIILEDDLVVSPYFYKYSQEALRYYNGALNIAGISLYNLPYAEAWKLPFIPLSDNSDVYFKQVPSSLGQAWSKDQWDSFKEWYSHDHNTDLIKDLPWIVKQYWSESSWKKYFYGYMIETNKFFVYPQISFTSNFNDMGENIMVKSHFGQVRLEIVNREYKFKALEESLNVYDAYSELLPDRLKRLNPVMEEYDFELDLYGKKDFFKKPFVITSKPCRNYILGFERRMKPIEMNIVFDLKGTELKLTKPENIQFRPVTTKEFINEYTYFYKNIFDTNILVKVLTGRIINKMKSIMNISKR
jgi:hypothetical protein